MLRMLRAAFLLWLIGYHPKPGEAYISDVGVAEEHQNEGVGQQMMEQAELWASNRAGPPDAVGRRDQ